MPIKFSKYVRQGKKTFRFIRLSGGAYGCGIEYEYGYFYGNTLDGIRFSLDKQTVITEDPDEKDGIGSMRQTGSHSAWIGSFTDGKKDGFCVDLKEDAYKSGDFYDMDRLVTVEEFKEKGEREEDPDDNTISYYYKDMALIYDGDRIAYMGHRYDDEKPFFCKILDDNGEISAFGFYQDTTQIPFVFDQWEEMTVDPVEEDGFSVLRNMYYFDNGNLKYKITEGQFEDGKLNGLGTLYYDSDVNGYHSYFRHSGVFKDGKLVFGYTDSNTVRSASFGYSDGREIGEYGNEIVYEGKKYIGEVSDGAPNGIGCLFEGDERMLKGTFKNGRLHGIGATYRLINDKWTPYDYTDDRVDGYYYRNSWGIFANGEFMPDMSWEEFFDKYEKVKKI